ncbi:Eco57I restriction-modification methylase domain-containing protein [Nocardia thailandica]
MGGLLPVDMLIRISEGTDVIGSDPSHYRVVGSRSVIDEAERHWDYLKSVWNELRAHLVMAPEADTPPDHTGRAIGQWLLPLFAEMGFGELTAVGSAGIMADDGSKTFAVSHRWNHVPIHLTQWQHSLDKRPGGAGTVAPQSLVQECLNRTESHLWAVVTNGRQLRLLRDSSALATASYIEFDLEAIFDGELFSEFVLLYRLLHVSRFAIADGAAATSCWLERWRLDAITSGTRALDQLRVGVEKAITTLGTGFLRHPENVTLREDVDVSALHNALLRLVYRLLFVFVAEDRDVLHAPDADQLARQRYSRYFSTARLRTHARRRRGTAHDDLYRSLTIVLDALGDVNGRPELGLPGIGGIFDDTDADAPLRGMSLSNEYVLTAVRHLAQVRDISSHRIRAVDYQHLDAEELGSIYESLLELIPRHSAIERTFELEVLAGNTRKTTGSYYTPSSLIDSLLSSTLDPVIDDAVKRGEQAAAAAGDSDPADAITRELLALKVCDPACGSGHFLVAAARRIAKRVAAVREHSPEPTVHAVRTALHDVISRCIYGVDLNPMAVELAKVSLWLEALEPGKPLSFLDIHIKCGNALIGSMPALLLDGIPNKAFRKVEGDEDAYLRGFAEQNDAERTGQGSLFEIATETKVANVELADQLNRIVSAPADTLDHVRKQAAAYRGWENSAEYRQARHIADAWCAAFMWRKAEDAPSPITDGVFRALQNPHSSAASEATHKEIVSLRNQYSFFHWHLEFPDVFAVPENKEGVDPATGWSGGFSCILGNPPWDKVDFEDKKYFTAVEPSIAAMSGTARRNAIDRWVDENVEAGQRYLAARRKVKSTFMFAGSAGVFPLCARGLSVKGVNSLATDHLFAERFTTIVAPQGRVGCIIPTAIATGAGAQYLFGHLTERGSISLLYDFENRKKLFDGVDSRQRFCLLSVVGSALSEPAAKFAFFLEDIADLDDVDRIFALAPEEIALINPNTGNLPVFRNRRDADLTVAIYRRIPVVWDETVKGGNRWQITFKNLFNMSDDSDLFRDRQRLERDGWQLKGNIFTRGAERMLPLYEAKMVDFYNHRAADVIKSETAITRQNQPRYLTESELRNPDRLAQPLNWVPEAGLIQVQRNGRDLKVPGVQIRLQELKWDRDWLCGWCDVTSATNQRTAIPALLPRTAVGHTLPIMLPRVRPDLVASLIAAQSSLVFDFVSRQKIGGIHMAIMVWKQLPVPTPDQMVPHIRFIAPRVLELVYTAYDMAGFARDLDDDGPPFRWDEGRRAQIRAELDAYFFLLYDIDRPDVEYMLETFQSASGGGLKNNEIVKYGHYRSRDLILAEYDRMAAAGVGLADPLIDGENYTSSLVPWPGMGPRSEHQVPE